MRYGSGKGIFGLFFTIKEEEEFGKLGTNGVGKTMAICILLGFRKANQGSCSVYGLNCWNWWIFKGIWAKYPEELSN
ncbi:MAG: hypothetical protein NUV41_15470 [Eubacteriales bacterium]|nr:hypothetical protein [Eubacteriales bacterium]